MSSGELVPVRTGTGGRQFFRWDVTLVSIIGADPIIRKRNEILAKIVLVFACLATAIVAAIIQNLPL